MSIDEIKTLLAQLKFKDWRFVIQMDGTRMLLVVEFEDRCAFSGKMATHRSRKWPLSPHQTKSEIVQTAFVAVMTAMEHEVRESFTYRDQAVYGPHYHVDYLHDLCEQGAFDVRPPMTATA